LFGTIDVANQPDVAIPTANRRSAAVRKKVKSREPHPAQPRIASRTSQFVDGKGARVIADRNVGCQRVRPTWQAAVRHRRQIPNRLAGDRVFEFALWRVRRRNGRALDTRQHLSGKQGWLPRRHQLLRLVHRLDIGKPQAKSQRLVPGRNLQPQLAVAGHQPLRRGL